MQAILPAQAYHKTASLSNMLRKAKAKAITVKLQLDLPKKHSCWCGSLLQDVSE